MARITAELTDGYAVDITAGQHTWRADEPEDVGGGDTGPTPYDLLLGALAACTCMTVSMYCERKGWSLDRVAVSYVKDRVHAEDCHDCEDDHKGYIDRIAGEVTIEGDFDEDQRSRIAQVAIRCPVHKTLDKGVHFHDEVEVTAG